MREDTNLKSSLKVHERDSNKSQASVDIKINAPSKEYISFGGHQDLTSQRENSNQDITGTRTKHKINNNLEKCST